MLNTPFSVVQEKDYLGFTLQSDLKLINYIKDKISKANNEVFSSTRKSQATRIYFHL